MKTLKILVIAFSLLLLADNAAFAQSSYQKNRQGFFKARNARSLRMYHRACAILDRKHNPPKTIFSLFRRKSKSGGAESGWGRMSW